MRGANEAGNFFNLPGSAPRPVIHDCYRVYIGYKKFTESRGRSHIVRPSASLAVSLPEFPVLSLVRPSSYGALSLGLETRWWGGQEVYRPYLYPCMVPIKREPLTAFVSDTVAVPAEARETAEEGVLVVVIGHQVLYPCRRGDGKTHTYTRHTHRERERQREAVARGRSNDTGYRVFHKDSMKIARDFITGEMSVNKNEYAD